jgi:4-amino-4-deoxy-L-arabinose transferase-like glycosyltransferase
VKGLGHRATAMADRSSFVVRTVKFGVVAASLLTIGLSILSRPDWKLRDFDQVFYVTIAYDLDRYGIFSDGIFDPVDSSVQPAQPGMFFGPVFPAMVLAAMKLDHRFAVAVRCSVESNRGHRDDSTCEAYEVPIRILNSVLLAGAAAIGLAADLIFRRPPWTFVLAVLFASAALANEADIFSFVMTESAIFAIYSVFAWALLRALMRPGTIRFAIAGATLGLLSLTKPSFAVLLPAAVAIVFAFCYWVTKISRSLSGVHSLIFALAFMCIVTPWMVRNYISLGKFGLTNEYASAVLVERFAYDDMTAQEFFLAFPYCTPGLGDLLFDKVYGADSMHRFVYHTPGSFFHTGRGRRESLIEQNGQIDPLIGQLVHEEMASNWWRYLAVTIPLAWCGMWPGGVVTLLLLPLFMASVLRAVRRREPSLIFYSAPAVLMLGLHAVVANHYTRYNLILIGPYSIGAAGIICSALPYARWRARSLALEP